MRSRIYLGHVMHHRSEPVQHGFRYPVFHLALDLDELDELDARLTLFGHNRRAVFALHDNDYLGGTRTTLRDRVGEMVRLAAPGTDLRRIELITTPRVVGYAFNPVSFFFCYDAEDHVSAILVEVNNTFGEGHGYVLSDPLPAGAAGAGHLRFDARKRFHVSPFNDMDGVYEFDFAPLGERLDVRIDIRRQHGVTFHSRLYGIAAPLGNGALLRLAFGWPLNAALTLPRILWQAYRLHYRHRLPVFAKPAPSSPATFRATRPAYISEFSTPGWLQRWRAPAEEGSASHGSD